MTNNDSKPDVIIIGAGINAWVRPIRFAMRDGVFLCWTAMHNPAAPFVRRN